MELTKLWIEFLPIGANFGIQVYAINRARTTAVAIILFLPIVNATAFSLLINTQMAVVVAAIVMMLMKNPIDSTCKFKYSQASLAFV